MPYIDEESRRKLDYEKLMPDNSGELSYVFSQIIRKYIWLKGRHYSTFNDITGALENIKLETFRREIGPYEQKKKEDNGDVFEKPT